MNFGGLPHEAILESMELIASDVLPAFSTDKEFAVEVR
jgi:hypothetical protein